MIGASRTMKTDEPLGLDHSSGDKEGRQARQAGKCHRPPVFFLLTTKLHQQRTGDKTLTSSRRARKILSRPSTVTQHPRSQTRVGGGPSMSLPTHCHPPSTRPTIDKAATSLPTHCTHSRQGRHIIAH